MKFLVLFKAALHKSFGVWLRKHKEGIFGSLDRVLEEILQSVRT